MILPLRRHAESLSPARRRSPRAPWRRTLGRMATLSSRERPAVNRGRSRGAGGSGRAPRATARRAARRARADEGLDPHAVLPLEQALEPPVARRCVAVAQRAGHVGAVQQHAHRRRLDRARRARKRTRSSMPSTPTRCPGPRRLDLEGRPAEATPERHARSATTRSAAAATATPRDATAPPTQAPCRELLRERPGGGGCHFQAPAAQAGRPACEGSLTPRNRGKSAWTRQSLAAILPALGRRAPDPPRVAGGARSDVSEPRRHLDRERRARRCSAAGSRPAS